MPTRAHRRALDRCSNGGRVFRPASRISASLLWAPPYDTRDSGACSRHRTGEQTPAVPAPRPYRLRPLPREARLSHPVTLRLSNSPPTGTRSGAVTYLTDLPAARFSFVGDQRAVGNRVISPAPYEGGAYGGRD